jgi:hypothetical protein
MNPELQEWLSDPDYTKGVEIYKKLGGSDAVLLSIFSLPETSFTKKKLVEALENMSCVNPKVDSSKVDTSVKEEKTPKPVLELIRRRSQLHETLFHTTSKSDRHKIALAILALGRELDRYYDHGELPAGQVENEAEESDIPVNAWELHQLINTNFAYMAKNKNSEDKQGEVQRRKRMNTKIEERLKSINYETSR